MISRIRIPHLIAAVIVVVAAMVAAQASFAQPVFTNPPCPGVKVVNNNPCAAQLRLVTTPPGVWPAVINLPSGVGLILAVPATGVTVNGVTDVLGVFHAFNPPPSPVAVCGPNAWWITNIFLAPAAACRFTVCADPVNCSITLW